MFPLCVGSPTERVSAPAPASSNLGSVASYSTSNLTQSNLTQVNSTSTVSLSSAIRKRRAPQPPPIPRIVEDPQSQSQSQSQPRQSPEHRTPQSASRPVVGPPVEASPGQYRPGRRPFGSCINPVLELDLDQRALMNELETVVCSRRVD